MPQYAQKSTRLTVYKKNDLQHQNNIVFSHYFLNKPKEKANLLTN